MRRHTDHRRTGWFDLFGDHPDVVEVNVVSVNPNRSAGDWHAHERQDDVWFVAAGALWVGLLDGDSDAEFQFRVLRPGDDPLRIPAGLWHTYKAGSDGAVLIYGLTNRYDPDDPDELRMPFGRGSIGVFG